MRERDETKSSLHYFPQTKGLYNMKINVCFHSHQCKGIIQINKYNSTE